MYCMVKEKTGSFVISRTLLKEIAEGDLKPGDNLPSEHEIMDRFQVSRAIARDVAIMLTGMGVCGENAGGEGVFRSWIVHASVNCFHSWSRWEIGRTFSKYLSFASQ